VRQGLDSATLLQKASESPLAAVEHMKRLEGDSGARRRDSLGSGRKRLGVEAGQLKPDWATHSKGMREHNSVAAVVGLGVELPLQFARARIAPYCMLADIVPGVGPAPHHAMASLPLLGFYAGM
jgi:hypothetical protein